MKKKVAREDRRRQLRAELRVLAHEERDYVELQALDELEDDGTLPRWKVRLTAPEHARWVADLIDHGRVVAGRLDARGVLGLFRSRSSPLSDHVETRWMTQGAEAADVVALVRRLEAEPAKSGEELVKRAASVVRWPKPANLFSALDQKTRRKSSAS